jgi:hypothetical protein
MKVILIFALLASSAFASDDIPLNISGNDCFINRNKVVAMKSWNWPFPTWSNFLEESLKFEKESDKVLTFKHSSRDIKAKIEINNNTTVIDLSIGKHIKRFVENFEVNSGSATPIYASTLLRKSPRYEGDTTESFQISCSLGVSYRGEVAARQIEEEMDRLGPPGEFDQTSPSISEIKVGTGFKLKEDLILSGNTRSIIVEDHGKISEQEFFAIPHFSRFASVTLSNVDNVYTESILFKKGSEYKIKEIKTSYYNSGGKYYEISFESLSGPLFKMKVEGRRSGKFDMKLPQFQNIVSDIFVLKGQPF